MLRNTTSATFPSPRRRSDANSRPSSEPYLYSFIHWLQLKKYQYEVTFSLYMLTSTEKFIFNLVLFVLVSMLVVAASLYLPNHVLIMYRRIWYYVHGEISSMAKASSIGGGGVVGGEDVYGTPIGQFDSGREGDAGVWGTGPLTDTAKEL